MTTGFHWTYGVVQQQSSGGGTIAPTVGLAITNLGTTTSFSPSVGTGAGNTTVNPIPTIQGMGNNEHTIQVNTTFSAGSGSIQFAYLEVVDPNQGSPNLQFSASIIDHVFLRSGRDIVGWMGNTDPLAVLLGMGGNDITFAGLSTPSTTVDVVASNNAATLAGSTNNVFYFNIQELAQSTAGVSTAGGFNASHVQSGDQLTFNFYVRNTNGLTNNATSIISIT